MSLKNMRLVPVIDVAFVNAWDNTETPKVLTAYYQNIGRVGHVL